MKKIIVVKKKKRGLRPWVKIVILFMLGVSVIAGINSVLSTNASEEVSIKSTYHGVLVGEDKVKMLSGDDFGKVITVDVKGANIREVVSVDYINNKPTTGRKTEGETLKVIENKYSEEILQYITNIDSEM